MSQKRFKIHLDPDEVLKSLADLGYHDVSQEHLKDFTKDLKKLIKYDLVKNNGNLGSFSSTLNGTGKSCSDTSTSSQSYVDTVDSPRKSRRPLSSKNSEMNSSLGSSSCSSQTSEEFYTESAKFTTKEMKPNKVAKKPSSKTDKPPRHDPVALYHYYQKFWKQFNVQEDVNNQFSWEVKKQTRKSAGDRLCF